MAKSGGFKISDMPARAKLAYYEHLNGTIDIADFENKSVDQIIDEYNEIKAKKNKWKSVVQQSLNHISSILLQILNTWWICNNYVPINFVLHLVQID